MNQLKETAQLATLKELSKEDDQKLYSFHVEAKVQFYCFDKEQAQIYADAWKNLVSASAFIGNADGDAEIAIELALKVIRTLTTGGSFGYASGGTLKEVKQ